MITTQKPYRGMQLNKTHPLARGLIGCWMMNEGTGGKVFDLSGNGNRGTIITADWIADGLDFNGTSDYVALPNIDLWDFGTESFSLVIGVQSSTAASKNLIRYDSGTANGLWGLRLTAGGTINFIIANESRQVSDLTGSVVCTDGKPHTIIGVRNASDDTLGLYIDGNQDNSFVSAGTRDIVGQSTAYPSIGRLGSYDAEYYDGLISYNLIYNRALSAEEIAWLSRESDAMFQQYMSPGLLYYVAVDGWTGEIIGITNPSEILGRATSGISEVNGI